MKSFAYARPTNESETVNLLGSKWGHTALLAGGTDLMSLMQNRVSTPEMLVDINHVESLKTLQPTDEGLVVGALTSLDDLLDSEVLEQFPAVNQAVDGIQSIQIRSRGTIGGELCQRPRCWYFRNGYGLLGQDGERSLPLEGDNRYHAILGNQGPALFVSPSRLAPALIALNAQVRIIGPDMEDVLPLEYFFVTPRNENQMENVLLPNQLLTHVLIPPADNYMNATYEVVQLQGLDWPLAAASASLKIEAGIVQDAKIVLGHVAPTPWVSSDAAQSLIGQPVTEETAQSAGDISVATATPLSRNGYKVQMARTAVKRAILRAAGLLEGGQESHV